MSGLKSGMLFASVLLGTVASPAFAGELRFLYVGDSADTALLGARQGLDEANLQGRFLGQSYTLSSRAADEPGDFTGVVAVLAAVDAGQLPRLAAAAPGIPVFNLRAHEDSLRTACMANVLHIIPSEAMDRDALAQWQKTHPDATGVEASAWHPDFTKYAARDLNKRYKVSAKVPMDDYAWAGWAAVKMASDTLARLGEGARLLPYLRTELRFDGQKGAEMSFRETGQLRQPLLLVKEGKIIGEAPVRGVAGPDDLDSLGNTRCGH